MNLITEGSFKRADDRNQKTHYSMNRSGLRFVHALLLVPFILSSCQPVAAGIKASVGFSLVFVFAALLLYVFGTLTERNKLTIILKLNKWIYTEDKY